MANYEAQNYIVTNGLVLNLDAGDPDSYTRSQPPYVEVLVVAGGGCGGNGNGVGYEAGGGGAGGVLYNSAYQLTNASAITVTIGAGGGSKTGAGNGNNGSNSVFGSLTAIGGGGGSTGSGTGQSGGSGGGGAHPKTQGGAGTAGQGFEGFTPPVFSVGGGGGGAGGPGNLGVGGNGMAYSISGTSTYYGGGGGGTVYSPNNGGLGGGGNGSTSFNSSATATGAANTGGGGGGGYASTDTIASGGAGGSGIVIIRYPGLPAATGGTITYLNGYTIHTFTSSGTFTPYLWNDVSGNNRNATLINGPAFASNENGGVLDFDGTDDYSTVPSNAAWAIGQNGTLEIWVKREGSVTTNHRLWCVTNNSTHLDAYVDSATSGLYLHGGTIGTNSVVPLNTWLCATVVYNSGTVSIYYNGVSQSLTGTSTGYNITGTGTLFIAQFYAGGPYYWNGKISNFKIYNRALSATEITQNYNAQKSRFGL